MENTESATAFAINKLKTKNLNWLGATIFTKCV